MWRFDSNHAAFTAGPLCGKVLPAQPQRGLHDLEIAGQKWPAAQLLQVGLPASHDQVEVAETYIRDCDLVATYAPLPPFTVQPQIYWRLRTSNKHRAVGVELIISVQTSLLFSEPQTTVACQFAAEPDGKPDILLAGDELPAKFKGMSVVQIPHAEYVLAQLIHPSDFDSQERDQMQDGSLRLQARLFQEHLEKGVIRRARAWAWFLPIDHWQSSAEELLAMLVSEPPPLTV